MSAASTILVLALSFAGSDAYSAVPSEHREWYVKHYESVLEAAQKSADQTQASIRRLRTRKEKSEAAAKVKELRRNVERLQKNDPPYIPHLIPADFAEGRVMRIEDGVPIHSGRRPYTIRVVQVLDDDEMLVQQSGRRSALHGRLRGSVTATTERYESVPFKLSGWPTRGAADGQVVAVEGAFRVTGTETYPTAIGGTNTVHVLEYVENLEDVFSP